MQRLSLLASKEVDVVIAPRSTTQYRAVRVERRRRDRTSARLLEKARVRLEPRQLVAIEVEHLDRVL